MRAADLPLFYNAVTILEHNLPARADKIALCSPSRTMTFQQVSDEVNQVANALRKLGVRSGDVVGVLAFDSPEWVTTFFWHAQSGGRLTGDEHATHGGGT